MRSGSRDVVPTQSRHPELDSGSIHRGDEGSPLTPTLSRRARGKKAAFTLAEVLITLAIIGVVATMTIPTLIADFQKKSTAIKVKKAYAELIQAIKLSEIDNGDFSTWNFGGDSASIENTRTVINKYIAPYYKGIWECGAGNDENTIEKKYCHATISRDGVNYALPNGTTLAFVVYSPTIPVIIGTSGKPEATLLGKDRFYFDIEDGKVKPAHWVNGLTRDDILNGYTDDGNLISCKKAKDEETELHRHGCTALFYLDGFEFKDDYPW